MKWIYTYLVILVISLSFNSCTRKGEADPIISLRSRDSRLIGEWELYLYDESYTRIYYDNNGNSYKYERNYLLNAPEDPHKVISKWEEITKLNPTLQRINYHYSEYSYSQKIKIDKNSKCSIRINKKLLNAVGDSSLIDKEYVDTINSYWFYNNSNKKKSGINIAGQDFHILRLTNDDLVLYYKHEEHKVNGETYIIKNLQQYKKVKL